MKNRNIWFYILAALGQFALDAYLPALPNLAKILATSAHIIQYSLGAFLISMAVSQPICGILSDKYGRKKSLLLGLILMITGSLICTLSTSVNVFMLGRVIQGLGAGATSVLTKVIGRDLYTGFQLKKYLGNLVSVWALALVSAPIIGGILTFLFNWQSVFLLQCFTQSICLIWIIFCYKETLSIIKIPTNPFSGLNKLLVNKVFLSNVLICMLCAGSIYSFNFVMPFIIQDKLHYSSLSYGFFSLCMTAGYIIGSMLSKKIIQAEILNILKLNLSLFFILTTVTGLFLSYFYAINIVMIIIELLILSSIIGFFLPLALSEMFSSTTTNFGLASSIYGIFVFGGGLFVNIIISTFIKISFFKLSILLLCIGTIIWLIFRASYPTFQNKI